MSDVESDNWRKKAFNWQMGILFLAAAADIITTHAFLSKGIQESNPIVRYIIENAGIGGFAVVRTLLTAYGVNGLNNAFKKNNGAIKGEIGYLVIARTMGVICTAIPVANSLGFFGVIK